MQFCSRKLLVLLAFVVGSGLFMTGCSTALVQQEVADDNSLQLERTLPQNQPSTSNHKLTQCFGCGFSLGKKQYRGHLGEDFGAITPGVAGDPVFAIRAGTVTIPKLDGTGDRTCTVKNRKGWGNYVVIAHPYPKVLAPKGFLYSLYGHLDSRAVAVGDRISEGQQIGIMGCTGFATAVHLHQGLVDRNPPGLGYLGKDFTQGSRCVPDHVSDSTGRTYYCPSLFFSAPTLRINGGLSSSKPQGQTFVTTGSGYTPNGTVTRILRKPDGSEVPLTPKIQADSSGNIGWSFTSSCSTPIGTSLLWVIDDTTGRGLFWSSHVEQIVTKGAQC